MLGDAQIELLGDAVVAEGPGVILADSHLSGNPNCQGTTSAGCGSPWMPTCSLLVPGCLAGPMRSSGPRSWVTSIRSWPGQVIAEARRYDGERA